MKTSQYLTDRTRIRHTAIEISMLAHNDMVYFLEIFLAQAPKERRQEFIDAVIARQFEDRGRWIKIDKWMNSCFEKHYDYKPTKVAHMCCVYWKMNWGNEPQLILRARAIKRKVGLRRKYAILATV
jgi:hypothetical protein